MSTTIENISHRPPLSKSMLQNNTHNASIEYENKIVCEIYDEVQKASCIPNTFTYISRACGCGHIRTMVVYDRLCQLFPDCEISVNHRMAPSGHVEPYFTINWS